MNNICAEVLKHPFATILIIATIGTAVAEIIEASKK